MLIYGVGWLGFDIEWPQIVISLGTVLITQYACTRLFRLPSFDPRSPLISGLSLCLLLRTNSLLLALLTAVITIVSKFVFKRGRKHIFNPTNFGIVAMMLLTTQVWVSPAQWGSKLYFAFFIACAGGMVIYRAARSDVTYAFLLAYVGILFGRAFWLGDPWSIPLKQLQSGSLLLFAFYMISDPKTTADSRTGRILFAYTRRGRSGLCPIRTVPHQWIALVPGSLFHLHSHNRQASARKQIRMDQSLFIETFERRNP